VDNLKSHTLAVSKSISRRRSRLQRITYPLVQGCYLWLYRRPLSL